MLLGEDQRLVTQMAVQEGRFLDEAELAAFEKRAGRVKANGLVSACPEDSPAWEQAMSKMEGIELVQPDAGEYLALRILGTACGWVLLTRECRDHLRVESRPGL